MRHGLDWDIINTRHAMDLWRKDHGILDLFACVDSGRYGDQNEQEEQEWLEDRMLERMGEVVRDGQ